MSLRPKNLISWRTWGYIGDFVFALIVVILLIGFTHILTWLYGEIGSWIGYTP